MYANNLFAESSSSLLNRKENYANRERVSNSKVMRKYIFEKNLKNKNKHKQNENCL